MNTHTRSNLIMILLIFLIIGTIVAIESIKGAVEDTGALKCISENSKLIVSKTCDYCYSQKLMLGDSIKYFEIIDIGEHPEVWTKYNLRGVPTWIIDEEKYEGKRSVENLKEITGC